METPHTTPNAANSPRALPLRSALKDDSDKPPTPGGANKAVQIAEPEMESASLEESPHPKQFTAGVGKRLSGRPAAPGNASRTSLLSQSSLDGLPGVSASPPPATDDPGRSPSHSHHHHRADKTSERLLSQLAEWIQHEKVKLERRKKFKVRHRRRKSRSPTGDGADEDGVALEMKRQRSPSVDSGSSDVSLDRLQRIVDDTVAALGLDGPLQLAAKLTRPIGRTKRSRSALQLARTASSDTEYQEGDVLVPSCDGVLDNSKAMSYSGGQTAAAARETGTPSSKQEKEKRAWTDFKNEVIRLAHTLRLQGWRRVPLGGGDGIAVERLSGALTNAVYVVTPPPELVAGPSHGRRIPKKLLLRVYGPQVEHLIDRENELSVLRRLARKKIGPRLLGTFENGRFEQFFNAETLTPSHLREPDTSRQIAKRMRELHDGIELLGEERNAGAAVWSNWDRWLDAVENAITFLDQKILSGDVGSVRGPRDAWKTRGLICGVEWHEFKAVVEKYRDFLSRHYGGEGKIRDKLVFAHNDTQYGNILRVRPDDERSPLLEPVNEHKQLIVIDFEYAAANPPALEFANHFTEWTYNYHDSSKPYSCNTAAYPRPDEQRRFIKAYVDHRPQFPHAGTPTLTPQPGAGTPPLRSAGSSSSAVEFMLDARVPTGGWREAETKREARAERQIKELMDETRLWRIANSAQWVAWGIVQAKVPDMKLAVPGAAAAAGGLANDHDGQVPDKADGKVEDKPGDEGFADGTPSELEEGEEDAFDYLGYAQERALFFWGDCVLMGFVDKQDLPEGIRDKIKLVEY